MKVKIIKNNEEIYKEVKLADNFFERFIGLMGKKNIDSKGLLLINCSAIHTFFMKITIAAVYINKDYEVVEIESIKPWRFGKILKGTKHVLELPTGNLKLKKGDKIRVERE